MKRLLFLLLLVPSLAFGDIKLDAPDSCEVGELVHLDASASDSELIVWRVIPETTDFAVVGKRAFFSGRHVGEYLFILAGSEDDKPVLQTHIIYVEGTEPTPGPSPTNDLAQHIRRWLTKVRSTNGQEEARKLAQSFRFIAGSPHTSIENFVEAASQSNTMVLGDGLEAWKPFLDGLGRYLDANPPGNLKEHQAVWLIIADSIEGHLK